MDRRQEAAVPDLRPGVRQVLAEHDVRRQIRVERSQPMADPGSQAGQRHRRRPGVHGQHRLEVLDDVGVHRPDHAELVGHRAEAGKQLADQEARLAVALEPERRSQERPRARLVRPQAERRDGLAMRRGSAVVLPSKVSTCENPPVRKSTIRCLALGG